MPRPPLLSEAELADALIDVPRWRRDGASIVREMPTSDFPAAVGLVNSIALLAEKADHHPDILLYGWNKVRITLSTHDQGGLTTLDFALARAIDALKFDLPV